MGGHARQDDPRAVQVRASAAPLSDSCCCIQQCVAMCWRAAAAPSGSLVCCPCCLGGCVLLLTVMHLACCPSCTTGCSVFGVLLARAFGTPFLLLATGGRDAAVVQLDVHSKWYCSCAVGHRFFGYSPSPACAASAVQAGRRGVHASHPAVLLLPFSTRLHACLHATGVPPRCPRCTASCRAS